MANLFLPRSVTERGNDAFFLGAKAYGSGITRVFYLDPEAVALLNGLPVGGGAASIMGAWYAGWAMEADTAAREALAEA